MSSKTHYIVELTHKLPHEKRDRAHALTYIDEFYSIHDGDEGEEVEYGVPLTEDEVYALYSDPPSNLDRFYEDVVDEIPYYDVDKEEDTASRELPEPDDQEYQRMQALVEEAEPVLDKVKMGVIDTGFDTFFPLQVTAGASFVDGEQVNRTENPHGMHVAGSASLGGRTKLYMAKALNNEGRGHSSAIARSIEWMIEQDVDVIVMSLSGPYRKDSPYNKPIARALEKGIIVKAAAGNTGLEERFTPAAIEGVEAISSFTRWTDQPADYTTYGSHVYQAGSGTSVLSYVLGGKMARFSGTSMATPNNAAVTACLIALHGRGPHISDAQAGSARRVDGVAGVYYGSGVVDGDEALKALSVEEGSEMEHLLVVDGGGDLNRYWVKIDGDAKFSKASNSSIQGNDRVYKLSDGSLVLNGTVAGGRDAIEFDGKILEVGFDTIPVSMRLVR